MSTTISENKNKGDNKRNIKSHLQKFSSSFTCLYKFKSYIKMTWAKRRRINVRFCCFDALKLKWTEYKEKKRRNKRKKKVCVELVDDVEIIGHDHLRSDGKEIVKKKIKQVIQKDKDTVFKEEEEEVKACVALDDHVVIDVDESTSYIVDATDDKEKLIGEKVIPSDEFNVELDVEESINLKVKDEYQKDLENHDMSKDEEVILNYSDNEIVDDDNDISKKIVMDYNNVQLNFNLELDIEKVVEEDMSSKVSSEVVEENNIFLKPIDDSEKVLDMVIDSDKFLDEPLEKDDNVVENLIPKLKKIDDDYIIIGESDLN